MEADKIQKLSCALCERNVCMVSYHHLIPKQKGGKHTDTVALCQPCHTTLHLTFTNQQLAKEYNTIDKLRSAEPLQKYLNWIQGKRIEKLSNKRKRK